MTKSQNDICARIERISDDTENTTMDRLEHLTWADTRLATIVDVERQISDFVWTYSAIFDITWGDVP